MKNYRRVSKFNAMLFIASISMLSHGAAHADDSIKRKSGLWESKVTIMGMTNSVQECVNHDTDNFLAQSNNIPATDCSVMDIQHQGKRISVHAVCKLGSNTVTTDGELFGDFNSAYSGKITTNFAEPVYGTKQGETTIDSKWLGACPPDRKAGSVTGTLPSGETIDLNDPKVKALLEALKANLEQGQK